MMSRGVVPWSLLVCILDTGFSPSLICSCGQPKNGSFYHEQNEGLCLKVIEVIEVTHVIEVTSIRYNEVSAEVTRFRS